MSERSGLGRETSLSNGEVLAEGYRRGGTMPRRSDEDFARAMRPHIEIETDRLIADGTPSEHAADPARLLRAE